MMADLRQIGIGGSRAAPPPSRPGELHPEPLTGPDVSLSTYPARVACAGFTPQGPTKPTLSDTGPVLRPSVRCLHPGPARHFPNPLLESQNRFRRDPPLWLAITGESRGPETCAPMVVLPPLLLVHLVRCRLAVHHGAPPGPREKQKPHSQEWPCYWRNASIGSIRVARLAGM